MPTGKMMPSPVSGQDAIIHQLTRIADHLTDTGEVRITCEQAQEAWEKAGMRIYYDAFTNALQNLGIIIT